MRIALALLVFSPLVACTGTKEGDSGVTSVDCGVTASTSIVDGATGVPGNVSFVVSLSAADAGATVSGSEPGTTAVSEDGLTLTWTPSPPVGPLTQVTMSLSTCAGDSTIGYTTSDLGGPLDADTDLTTTSFRFDLTSGTVVEPPTGGALLSTLGAGLELLLGLTPAGAGVDYRVGVGAKGAQDLCARTLDVSGGTLDGGWFGFGPAGATFPVYDTQVVLEDLAFGGAVLADGSAVEAGWLRTYVGIEALAVAYADGDVAEACAFFGNLGATCTPCPSGAGECLALEVIDLTGVGTGTPVEQVTAACEE